MDVIITVPDEVVDAINDHISEANEGFVKGGKLLNPLPYTDVPSYIANNLGQAFGQLLLSYPQPGSIARKQQIDQLEANNEDAARPTVRESQ